ncbi:MAG: GldM family protein [Bacteroidota bacterium]
MKSTFLFAFILLTTFLQAQNSASLSVVSPIQMNILYIGIQNPLAIAVPGYQEIELIVTTNEGVLKKSNEPNVYLLSDLTGEKREVIISVSVRGKDGVIKKVGDNIFRVRKIPAPDELILGTIKNNDTVNVTQLISASHIYANISGFPFSGIEFEITKYNILYQPKNGVAIAHLEIVGSTISNEIKKMFENAKSGDKIILSNVQAVLLNNGSSYFVPTSSVFVLK